MMTYEDEKLKGFLNDLLSGKIIIIDTIEEYTNNIREYLKKNKFSVSELITTSISGYLAALRDSNISKRAIDQLAAYILTTVTSSETKELVHVPDQDDYRISTEENAKGTPLRDAYEQVAESLNRKPATSKKIEQLNTKITKGVSANVNILHDKHDILKGDAIMSENDKGYNSQYIREDMQNIENRITRLISDSENRIHEDKKDMEQRIHADREKFQEWLKDLSGKQDERIKGMEDHNKQLNDKIDNKVDALTSKLDANNKALEGKINSNNHAMWALAISTMIGIAAIAVAVFIALFK